MTKLASWTGLDLLEWCSELAEVRVLWLLARDNGTMKSVNGSCMHGVTVSVVWVVAVDRKYVSVRGLLTIT